MKKIVRIMFLLLIIGIAIFLVCKEDEPIVEKESIHLETEIANISSLYFYGNHFNIEGTIDLIDLVDIKDISFTIYENSDFPLLYEINDNIISFKSSVLINTGIYLDDLPIGTYKAYIKITDINDSIKYYLIKNNTSYAVTEYYTISKNNNCNLISISSNDTLKLDVSLNNNYYDIVLDPGHGGIDPGACSKGYCEIDFNTEIALKLKSELENSGYKVLLTRENEYDENTRFYEYGEKGRVNIANNSKAKYLFSIHLNSSYSTYHGFEIYTPNNIDYAFSSSIAKSIVETAKTSYSNNVMHKMYQGVYTRTFSKKDVSDTIEDMEKESIIPYNVTTDTVYYFIIRETGGILTGAYVDGRADEKLINYSYNTNVGIESYILELGYINSSKDRTNIKNNMDLYVNGIKDAIINELSLK